MDNVTVGYWTYRRRDGRWECICDDTHSYDDEFWSPAPEPHLLDEIERLRSQLDTIAWHLDSEHGMQSRSLIYMGQMQGEYLDELLSLFIDGPNSIA